MGMKVGFEVIARLMQNTGIDKVGQVMIDILKSRPAVTRQFIGGMCDFSQSETLWEVLLDCTDGVKNEKTNAKYNLARVLKYALC